MDRFDSPHERPFSVKPSHTFRRAIVLAMAWWLVGLGIDLGADSRAERHPDERPAAVSEYTRAQRAPWDHDPPARIRQPDTKSRPGTPQRDR
jgi:hypothetical protein